MVVKSPVEYLGYNCRHVQVPQQRGLTTELHIVTDEETGGQTHVVSEEVDTCVVHNTCIIYSEVF